MKIKPPVAAALLLIPVIWFVSGHRFTRDAAPDFRDAPRDISSLETNEFGRISAASAPDLPVPQAADVGGDSAQPDKFLKYLGGMYKSPLSAPVDTGNYKSLAPVSGSDIGQILYSFKVEKLLNAFLYSDLTFRTAKGNVVHLSGNMSSNCPGGGVKCEDNERVFIILTTANGGSRFVRVMDVVNYGIFMSGSKTVEIDGEQFTAKVYADASSPEQSQIEITSGGSKVLESTLIKLSDMAARKGAEVRLGRSYRLLYGSEISAQGKTNAKFTDSKQVILMPFPVSAESKYYLLDSSDITPSGVLYPELDRRFGFKQAGGVLDIFRLK